MIPRWLAVAAALRRRIAEGDHGPDGAFPTETELGAEFSVSRITIRRALDELRGEGLLVAGRGRGWQVTGVGAGPPIGVFRVTADGSASGVPVAFETLEFATRRARTDDPGDGSRVLRALRLATVDGLPFDLVEIVVGTPYASLVTEAEIATVPPARLLAQKGCVLGRTDQWASAQPATSDDEPLGMQPGTPLLVVERNVYSANLPVLRTTHRHPGNLVRIDVTFPTTNTADGSPVAILRQ